MGGVPVHGEMTTGSVFFVDSVAGSDGNTGKKPTQAFATLDKATNSCTANKNDIVYIMPNHAETIAASTTWIPDVAGVKYIGIGMGADAPELTFSATGSTIDISGGNNVFQNIRFVAGISAVSVGCDVNANHVTFDGCVWDFGAGTYDFVIMVEVDAFDYCTIKNCQFIAENAKAGADHAIRLDDCHHVRILNNIMTGDFAAGAIVGEGAIGKSLIIADNMIYNDDTAAASAGIDLNVAFTGMIARNMITSLYDGGDLTVDPGSCQMFENYIATLVDTYGAATLVGSAST